MLCLDAVAQRGAREKKSPPPPMPAPPAFPLAKNAVNESLDAPRVSRTRASAAAHAATRACVGCAASATRCAAGGGGNGLFGGVAPRSPPFAIAGSTRDADETPERNGDEERLEDAKRRLCDSVRLADERRDAAPIR